MSSKTNNKKESVLPCENIWIVYMLPFGDKGTPYIFEYQQNCIRHQIFGLGWRNMDIPKYASNYWSQMKENDLVLSRMRDGYYYVGRIRDTLSNTVSTDIVSAPDVEGLSDKIRSCAYSQKGNETEYPFRESRLSVYRYVDKWYRYPEYKLPSNIVGRLSQRFHKTIERISDADLYLTISRFFANNTDDAVFGDLVIPKIQISRNNFASALTAGELEDLVFRYITSKNENKGYRLLPSACKNSTVKYEFYLKKEDGSKPVTCQVKNREYIDLSYYLQDFCDYERIYIFSAIGYKNEPLKLPENFIVIGNDMLYGFLCNDTAFKKTIEEYCEFV